VGWGGWGGYAGRHPITGKYYAAESMLVLNPETGEYDADMTPSYGEDTLEAFFKKCLEEGMEGQELGDAAVWGQK
jgi:divinyl chlorophyllide a 8-vinyl-reductase